MAISKDLLLLNKEKFQKKLLHWFKKNKRDLPWRKTKDPYAIWVSEIMLQQTQVATVIPYFEKFLKTFPTIPHLANAPLSEVLKIWEGLGYYTRARNLHQASRIIGNQFNGRIPNTLTDLLNLPGIGRYTAGAILSIAFNKEAPILDGNVKRVLSRLFAISMNPGREKAAGFLWQISESLIPKGMASPFNQALMDLGAMVCTPKDPQCIKCPFCDLCRGYLSGKPKSYPPPTIKKRIPHITAVSAVIEKDKKVLLNQRPPKGLLGGLWEFPNWTIDGQKNLMEYLNQKVKSNLRLRVKCKVPLSTFKQTYSHFKLTLHVFQCQYLDGKISGRWVAIGNLNRLPMSRIHRRIAESISN